MLRTKTMLSLSAAIPSDACSTSGERLRRPIWTDAGDVHVSLSTVFADDPDMDDVSYDETRADSYGNYSEDFDPKRLLVVVLKRSDVPLAADDLTDFSFQPAGAEGEFRICDEPLDTDVRQAHVEAWPERSVTFAADTSRCAGVTWWYREVLSAEGRISRQVGCVQR